MQMFGEIPDFLVAWIEDQQMFWVASAPLTADGLVNISPKGVEGTFHIAGPRKVWYEDLSGTGTYLSCLSYEERLTNATYRYRNCCAHTREWTSNYSIQRVQRSPQNHPALRQRFAPRRKLP